MVVSYFKTLQWQFSGVYSLKTVTIIGLPAVIRTGDVPHMVQEC